MPLQFRGVAHPAPGVSSPDVANLNSAEISLTDLGSLPLLHEHDPSKPVGRCLASWEGPGGELRVAGVIEDEGMARQVRNGSNHGLSLGTDVVQNASGKALFKDQQELSVCHEPRRRGCYIDTVDGRSVRAKRRFSTGDSYSKEYVEKLKADLASGAEENARLRAFKSGHDAKQRDVISKLQPDITSFVDELVKQNVDHAPEMKSIAEWSRGCHESKSLETAMPLARVLSCASASLKRTREEASANAEKAGTLGATMKELETLKAADAAKAQRITELEELCAERQTAMGQMQDELAKSGLLKDKFDFSKLSSREAKAPAEPAATPELQQVTSTASRGAFEDELMSFVSSRSVAGGNGMIMQSGTAHAHLGASSSGSMDGEIAAAIRGY